MQNKVEVLLAGYIYTLIDNVVSLLKEAAVNKICQLLLVNSISSDVKDNLKI